MHFWFALKKEVLVCDTVGTLRRGASTRRVSCRSQERLTEFHVDHPYVGSHLPLLTRHRAHLVSFLPPMGSKEHVLAIGE